MSNATIPLLQKIGQGNTPPPLPISQQHHKTTLKTHQNTMQKKQNSTHAQPKSTKTPHHASTTQPQQPQTAPNFQKRPFSQKNTTHTHTRIYLYLNLSIKSKIYCYVLCIATILYYTILFDSTIL